MRRMVPFSEWNKLKQDVANNAAKIDENTAKINEKVSGYVGTILIEETDWTDGTQGQEVELENELFTSDNIIIVSEDTEEGRANYELIRDLEIIPVISEAGVLKLIANTHETISGDAVITVVVITNAQELPEAEDAEE